MSEHEGPVRLFPPNDFILLVEHDARLNDRQILSLLRTHPALEAGYGAVGSRNDIDRTGAVYTIRMKSMVPVDNHPSDAAGALKGKQLAAAKHMQKEKGQKGPKQDKWGDRRPEYISFIKASLDPEAPGGPAESHPNEDADRARILTFVKAVNDSINTEARKIQTNWKARDRRADGTKGRPSSDEGPIASPEEKLRPVTKHQNRLGLQGITLNWYMAPTPHQIGVGGPGAKPVEVPLPSDTEHLFWFNDFVLDTYSGAGATVFVLDTVPDTAAVDAVSDAWNDHEPLDSLDSLDVWSNPILADEVWDPGEVCGYEDDIVDHGLFAAGIVRTIAPEATIKMIQVLDRKGVGSYEAILNGFEEVLLMLDDMDSVERKKSVVNCSFTLAIPDDPMYAAPPAGDCAAETHKGVWEEALHALVEHPELGHVATLGLQALTSVILARGASIVGAAGNEGRVGAAEEDRPSPRYPAAATEVIGVGAGEFDGTTLEYTSYSNIADHGESDGFMTLGGEVTAGTELMADATKGILGVSTIYPGGWARWAGTSFATPIVSAALALLLRADAHPSLAINYLRNLGDPTSPEKIKVTQGLP